MTRQVVDHESAVLTEIERRLKQHHLFEEECGCMTANTTTPRPTDVSTHASWPLVFSTSCLDESTSRLGPGQHPRCTRAPFGEEAVGSPQSTHHRAPQAQPMSQRQHPTRDESLAKILGIYPSSAGRFTHLFYAGLHDTIGCVPLSSTLAKTPDTFPLHVMRTAKESQHPGRRQKIATGSLFCGTVTLTPRHP